MQKKDLEKLYELLKTIDPNNEIFSNTLKNMKDKIKKQKKKENYKLHERRD